MKFTNIELQNTGGGCMVLYIEVEGKNFKTIGLNDECIVLYDNTLSEIEEGEYNEHTYIDMTVGNPWTDLEDAIGKKYGKMVHQIFKNEYVF